jgi:DNA-binding response OmpR family regulator
MPAKKKRLLVADDDPQFLKLLKLKLQFENYDVLSAQTGKQVLRLFEQETPDMLIMEINMREINGFEVCRRVREFSSIPIIFVTTREQIHDRIKGFYLGADDFLTKPFDLEEFLARVHAILRRSQMLANAPQSLQPSLTIGALTINFVWHQVFMNGRELAITPIEYNLLSYFARHAGRVLTHYQLLSYVWGEEYGHEQQILRVNINRLRQKLEPDPAHPSYIHTKSGLGYMLSFQPRSSRTSPQKELVTYG